MPRNKSIFTRGLFKNFPGGETPGPLLTKAGKGGEGIGMGLKVTTSKGMGGRKRTGEGEEGKEGKVKG